MKIISNISIENDGFENINYYSLQEDFSKRPVSILEIIDKLPKDFNPVFFIFRTPLYLMVPYDIEKSPLLTVCLLDDCFSGLDYLLDILKKFDYIFTDRTTISLLNQAGFDNVDYWPCFGYDPKLFRYFPNEKKIYDVSFVGNLNVNIQTNRMWYLKRLTEIKSKYNVKIITNIFGEDYVKILNQSKIVFNHSIKSEMNMRAFEATACNTLLFMEESNLEIRDFFTPNKECILYNKNNFEDLLYYYLENEKERKNIAQAAWEKSKNYSYNELFKLLLKKINSKKINKHNKKRNQKKFYLQPQHIEFIQISLSKNGLNKTGTLDSIIKILSNTNDHIVINNCAVLLLFYTEIFKKEINKKEEDIIIVNSIKLLEKVEKIFPKYMVAKYNHAYAYLIKGDIDIAEEKFLYIYNELDKFNYESYLGLISPLNYILPIRVLWSNTLSDALFNKEKISLFRHNCLRAFSAYFLGNINEFKNNKKSALKYYSYSNNLLPDQAFILAKMTSFYEYFEDFKTTKDVFNKAFKKDPFEINIWKNYYHFLIKNNKTDEAKKFYKKCVLISNRVSIFSNINVEEELKNINPK
jgi:hypothetical protein